SRLAAVPRVHRDVHRPGAKNGQALLEDLFEFLARAALHQHVPMGTRRLGLLLLRTVAVHQECRGPADLALPLRRDLRLDREGHLEAMPLLTCVLHGLARSQVDAAVRLVAGHYEARTAKSSLTHESCLPGLSPTGQVSLSSSSGQRPVGGKDSRSVSRSGSCVAVVAALVVPTGARFVTSDSRCHLAFRHL